jgi:hypothetical protein
MVTTQSGLVDRKGTLEVGVGALEVALGPDDEREGEKVISSLEVIGA